MSSDEEDSDCPLCMEELDIADRNFRPCPCGYQICRFCWHHIKTNLNGRCPACRRLYSDQIVEFVPVSAEEIVRLKKEKKEKDRQTRDMRDPSRRQLSNVRVVQKNLVYVLGLSLKHASVDNEFFKKYGRIEKVVISKRSAPSSGSNSSVGIYVTFARKEDAGKAIEGMNGMEYDGKTLRASYGTTKYCTYYLRHMACPNPNCMYLHEPGDDVDSYSKDTVAIGKHANSSVSSSSATAYPNKRPATALKATPVASSSTTTATTPEPKPATTPRTWAPIPKVVPIPPVVVPKEEPPVAVVESPPRPLSPPFKEIIKPSSSTKKALVATVSNSTAKSTKPSASKKPAVEKPKKVIVPLVIEEDEKPALPATASWAKAQPVVNHESVITPANFGPSLSDALHAPQKPKHSPYLKVKKEKKIKGKMVRLEEFEEAEREAKIAATKPKVVVKPAAPIVNDAKPVQIEPKANHVEPPVVSEQPFTETKKETKDEVKSDIIKHDDADKPEMVEIKKTLAPTKETIVEEPITSQEQAIDEVMEEYDEPQVDDIEEDDYISDDIMNNDSQEEIEYVEAAHDNEKIEDLASLNDDIIKAFDNAANESSEKVQADESRQQDKNDTLSEHETTEHLPQTISSPMAAMDRLSALVQQEIMTDSPEPPQFDEINAQQQQQQHQQQQQQFHHQQQQGPPHPDMKRFDMGMAMQQPDNRRSPMPPPGLGNVPPPPDWMNRSFDPFNGQDPSLIAARRLQHSQRMLEASGLFGGGGFGHPPVVPRFGFSPDFNHGPSGFLPHQPPPPPLGMFPPPPPPHPMMRGPPPPPPEMMNMQSPFGPPPPMQMDDLRNEFGNMKMNGEDHQSREDFRALLPNVNISFNNLQEKRRAEEFYQQQQLLMRQQQMQRMSEQGDIPTRMNNVPMRHPSFNNSFSSQEKILLRSPANNNQWQQQAPPGMTMENEIKVDAMEETRNNPDVRVEAQNFFGEFLRKAASSTPQPEMSPKKEEQPIQPATLPFQDPAIMSVRLNEAPVNDAVRSQNTILQILGGQPPPPSPLMTIEQQQQHHHQQQQQQHHHHQQQMLQFHQQRQQQQQQQQHHQQQQQHQRQMDPRFVMDQGRMMHQDGGNFNDMGPKHFNNMFMGPPPPNFQQQQHQQQQQQQQQQQRQFHQQQQQGNLPPPPSSFMTGFREPNMGMMGRMGPPPGMMRPPMPPPPNDMRFRNGHMGNGQPLPPGMFSEESHH